MNIRKNLIIFGMLITSIGQAQSTQTAVPSKKVIFIIVDGISNDQLKAVETPYLDSISASGGYSNAYVGGRKGAYSETPTISAVGYNSLLTGTWANKHNVWGNNIKEPNYSYPTIFKLYKDQYPNGTIGVFSSWLDNRTKLVGDGLKETGHLQVDYHFDGLEYDTINFPHDEHRNFMKLMDYTVADYTAQAILEKAPDLSWVYLEYSDDIGHRFGDSEMFHASIRFEDKLIGKIWKAIKERQATHNEEWLLLITTDHGRTEENGKHHGGQSDRERSTWIITNKNTNTYFKTHTTAIVDLLPTMADYLNIDISTDLKRELDGVSLIQPVDAINLNAEKQGDNLVVKWEGLSKGNGKLFVSGTNNIKSGKEDSYQLLANISLEEEQVSIPIIKIPEGFCKLVLETSHTTINTWISTK